MNQLTALTSNKWMKRSIAFLSDLSFTYLSWLANAWLAFIPVLQGSEEHFPLTQLVLLQSLLYILCGLYRGVWRFSSIPDLVRITKAVLIGTCFSIFLLKWSAVHLPTRAYLIHFMFLMLALSGSRLLYRGFRDFQSTHSSEQKTLRTLIVGAGNAGEGLIRDLYRSKSVNQYQPIAIVDDDPAKQGFEVRGVRILGPCKKIPKIVKTHAIELILIAIPSLNSKRMREIVRYCEESRVPFRTLPSIKHIADGNVSVNSLRPVLIDDLLGREQVDLDWQAIRQSVQGKRILVTGGGGSIGSELCRQILRLAPAQLIIVDNSEFNLYTIDNELRAKFTQPKLYSHLCNITDRTELEFIFNQYQPELVFHVAAYKHVPLLESHLRAALYNNIIGTKMVAEAAERAGVQSFVFISTDKAVNPSSIMGASKRAAEIFCQMLNLRSQTRFITVRFGNVLDSAGSVLPLFRSQLQNGGPLTVTHPDITRYFMTIPEASQLILQANAMENQGDIFVLDMGEPIKISYLAEQMIILSGKTVGQDIDIIYTGLRPGEKLYEELFHENEIAGNTSHLKIKQAKVRHYHWSLIQQTLEQLEKACTQNDDILLTKLLYTLVPEYKNNQQSKMCVSTEPDPRHLNYVLSAPCAD